MLYYIYSALFHVSLAIISLMLAIDPLDPRALNVGILTCGLGIATLINRRRNERVGPLGEGDTE